MVIVSQRLYTFKYQNVRDNGSDDEGYGQDNGCGSVQKNAGEDKVMDIWRIWLGTTPTNLGN